MGKLGTGLFSHPNLPILIVLFLNLRVATQILILYDMNVFSSLSNLLINQQFENLPVGIAVVNNDYRILNSNPAWNEFARSALDLDSKTIRSGISLADLSNCRIEIIPLINQALKGETFNKAQVRIKTAGVLTYWDLNFSPLLEQDIVVAVQMVTIDRTEQVIGRMVLENEIEQQSKDLITLLQVAKTVGSSLSLEEVLRRILSEMVRVVEYDGCVIYTLADNQLIVRAVTGILQGTLTVGEAFPVDNELDQQLLCCDSAITIGDVEGDEEPARLFRTRWRNPLPGVRAWMGINLSNQERTIGEMVLVHGQPGYFDQIKEDYVLAIANQAAIALENARLFQAETERLFESERRRRVAEGLQDILKALNSNMPLNELLHVIVDQVEMMMGADLTIRYKIEDSNQIATVSCSDFPTDLADRLSEYKTFNMANTLNKKLVNGEYVIHSDYPAIWKEVLEKEINDEEPAVIEITRLFAKYYQSGLVFPVLVRGEYFGSLRFCYKTEKVFDDETLQLAALIAEQTALAIENANLRADLQTTAVSAERNRLARELHDSVTQTLFSASLIAEVLPRIWELNPQEGARRVNEIRQLSRGALAEMRTLLMELRPNAIFEADPSELLRHLVDAFSGRTGVHVTYEKEIDPAVVMSGDQKLVIYRITQEALNNISKHANAQQVLVHFRVKPEKIVLLIQDDGQGFDLSSTPTDHFGLSFMKERAEVIGAKCTITSQVGEGTLVKVTIKM